MDLIQVLQSHGVEIRRYGEHHHATRGRISVDCPKCSLGSQRFRLGLDLHSDRTNCWRCGRLDRVEILALLLRVSIHESITICGKFGYRSTRQEEDNRRRKLELPKGLSDLLPAHIRYLRKRGFDPDDICRIWDVQGIGVGVTGMQWRLFIPIYDHLGDMVSWTTRSIGKDTGMKYRSASPEQEIKSHKHVLYGSHLARHTVVITEGPLDVWAIGPGTVATLGLAYTREQESEIAAYPVRVICFDSEEQAQKSAEKLCNALSSFSGVTEMVTLESGTDPANSDPEEIRDLRRRFLDA